MTQRWRELDSNYRFRARGGFGSGESANHRFLSGGARLPQRARRAGAAPTDPHPQLSSDLLGVDPLALIGERGIARDHEHVRDPRQIRRQILGDSVREILLLRVIAEVGERQHHDRQARRSGTLGDRWSGRYTGRRQRCNGFRRQRIDPHRPRDVLDALLAQADRTGRIRVGPDLSVLGHPDIFAIGDTALSLAWDGQPVPGLAPAAKQGGAYPDRTDSGPSAVASRPGLHAPFRPLRRDSSGIPASSKAALRFPLKSQRGSMTISRQVIACALATDFSGSISRNLAKSSKVRDFKVCRSIRSPAARVAG
jgi:hypothetical protein